MMRYLSFLFFASGLFAGDVATSMRFSPLLLSLTNSWRVQTNLSFQSTPSGELEAGFLYKVWDGFDVGLGLHGGMVGDIASGGILGFDGILRFIRPVSSSWFLGFQSQVGYVYTGIGNVGRSLNHSSAIPVNVGLVFGGAFRESTQLYFFPSVNFGKAPNAGDPLWKSGVGLEFAIGTAIALKDDIYWVIETQPEFSNLVGDGSAWNTFTVGLTLGLLFDF